MVVTAAAGAAGTPVALDTTRPALAGLARAVSWMQQQAGSAPLLVVIEGRGSYDAQLSETAVAARLMVGEHATLQAASDRGVGKTDAMDAVRIARSVLAIDADRQRWPRACGRRTALRVLTVCPRAPDCGSTKAGNALIALLLTLGLGTDVRKALTRTQIDTTARWRGRDEPLAQAGSRHEAVRLARRPRELDRDLAENAAALCDLVVVQAPRTARHRS